jgi:pyruvate/2-oxoglutarate dehydrogenase complex dihydrolipoamide acyltransferase (E2) component
MEITLTGISQDSKEATITLWHVEKDERVAKGQDLVEVATDKATFDVSAPCSGVLAGIKKRAGDTVRTDEVIAVIREDKS